MVEKVKYIDSIAKHLNATPDDLFLYWKGRVALYALLKAMGVSKGDEVILPAYSCVVVPNAILYLGAKPVYVDVDLETYNANIHKIKDSITDKTKVIICQNSFGLSSNLEEIVELANLHHLYTIEDCTHGFGGVYQGKPNGSYCDAAFYSTQWNKPFSTGIGGFALVKNDRLRDSLVEINKDLLKPPFKKVIMLKILYFVKKHLLKGSTYWSLVALYRFLSKHNLVVGSSSGEEISSVEMPKDYFMGISSTQVKAGLINLSNFDKLLETRKKNATIFTEYLMSKSKNHVPKILFENHSFLKYPLLVSDREWVMTEAEKQKIELGDWFNSPIHPVQEGFHQWGLFPELFPNAFFAGQHMVNLPTDTQNPEKVCNFMDSILELIMDEKPNV